jgi:hypothetical protein
MWVAMYLECGLQIEVVTSSDIICHVSTTCIHVSVTSAPRGIHVSATWHPRQHHVIATWHPCHRYVAATSVPSGSHVSNQLISKSDVASQSMTITFVTGLGFGLGSMGIIPIYDELRTSWIMLIYDENISSSRRLTCDAQYVTF